MFGNGKDKQFDIKTYIGAGKRIMLADYFEQTVGTPMEMPYYELVLYTHSDSHALLEQYTDGGTEAEMLTMYLVPIEDAQRVMDAIRESGMSDWPLRNDLAGLCGKLYVCKFPDGSGGYMRISSEAMPQDGREAFGRVLSAIGACRKEEYLQ